MNDHWFVFLSIMAVIGAYVCGYWHGYANGFSDGEKNVRDKYGLWL